MSRAKRLIIGLGNPGPEYEGTRHNVGYAVADDLAGHTGISLEKDRAEALVGWGTYRGRVLGIAKPLTFMNLSGTAVKSLLRLHALTPDDLLVVYDDIHLEPGTIRLRERGSAGGHNGVQHIIDRIGTTSFARLRIGIGSAFSRGRQADYVLAPFSRVEQPLIDEAIVTARDAALTYVREGITTAMNRFNRR